MHHAARNASFALLLTALLALPAAAQDSVAGEWVFSMDTPQGQIDVDFVFEQDGTEVTGTATMTAMPEVEGLELTDGEFVDGVLFFLMHASVQGQWFTVEMEADVDGDEMVGEAYVAEMGEAAPFTGKRKTGQ